MLNHYMALVYGIRLLQNTITPTTFPIQLGTSPVLAHCCTPSG